MLLSSYIKKEMNIIKSRKLEELEVFDFETKLHDFYLQQNIIVRYLSYYLYQYKTEVEIVITLFLGMINFILINRLTMRFFVSSIVGEKIY